MAGLGGCAHVVNCRLYEGSPLGQTRCRASPPVKEIGMPIDSAALARNLSSLAALDVEHDLPRAMQQITSAAKALLGVDGAGLMLADERGQLRWATASDQQTQTIEEGQERLGQGPCVNAFAEHAPMAMRDAAKEPQWGKITDVVTGQEMRAGLSVPVQLEGGPIGTLDLYSAEPRDWDQAEISAAQVYAALAATLLSQAVGAQVKGRLAEQLQTAFAHRTRIERAKGMLMVREGIDDAEAFERLRSAARSSRRPLIEVVDEVLGGQRLPSSVPAGKRRRFMLDPCRTEPHWSAAGHTSGPVWKQHPSYTAFATTSDGEGRVLAQGRRVCAGAALGRLSLFSC
jgi:putative methionine-R-sulfoxide reductase with GAF domain